MQNTVSWNSIIPVVLVVIGMAATWGMFSQRVSTIESRQIEDRQVITNNTAKIHTLETGAGIIAQRLRNIETGVDRILSQILEYRKATP